MKRTLIPLTILLLAMLGACAPSVRIVSDRDETAAFDKFRTYTFMEFTEGNIKTIPGMELERLKVAFAREIEKRGLVYVGENADINVQIVVYHREASSGTHYYRPYRYNYMERAIAIDFYDNATRMHIWHAAAVGELQSDPQKRSENFPKVAAALMEQYPVAVQQGV
jgi:hypothetical protein